MTYDVAHDEGLNCEIEAEATDIERRGQKYVVQITTYGPRRGFGKGNPEGVVSLSAADARELRDDIDDILRKIGEH